LVNKKEKLSDEHVCMSTLRSDVYTCCHTYLTHSWAHIWRTRILSVRSFTQ